MLKPEPRLMAKPHSLDRVSVQEGFGWRMRSARCALSLDCLHTARKWACCDAGEIGTVGVQIEAEYELDQPACLADLSGACKCTGCTAKQRTSIRRSSCSCVLHCGKPARVPVLSDFVAALSALQ